MNHEDAARLLGAYALDALDPDEAGAVAEHVESCPRCRPELASLRETASALGEHSGSVPPGLWDKIAGQLSEPGPPLRLEPARLRRAWSGWPLQVVAVAAAVAVAFLGVDVAHLDSRVGHLQAAISRTGLAQAAGAATLAPGSRRLELTSHTGTARAVVVVLPDGQGYFLSSTLPSLGAGRTYQLWGLNGTKPISIGLLGRSPAPAAFRVDHHLSALMVTAEPGGGTIAPTTPVLVQAALAGT
jgi:hypothetical protein